MAPDAEGSTALRALVLSLRPDVSLVVSGHDTAVVEAPHVRITLGRLTPPMLDAVRALRATGAPRDRLLDPVRDADGAGAAARLARSLEALDTWGLLRSTLLCRGQPLLTCTPIATHHRPPAAAGPADRWLVLSRFAFLRRLDDRLVLESPLSHLRIDLHGAGAVALVAELASPRTVAELRALHPEMEETTAPAVVALLAGAGMLTDVAADDRVVEDGDAGHGHWEFHDLLFHSRSRLGRHGTPYGRVAVPPAASGAAEPVLKPVMSGVRIALPTPDIERILPGDPPFGVVVEARASVRQFGDPPLTLAQVGEFLYRVARVKRVVDADGDTLSVRPYPSGGACYELELYLVVNECQDLEPGLYHYQPLEHALYRLSASEEGRRALLRGAAGAMNRDALPQILVVLTARMHRVTSRYRSMAYAMTLKHVGVLFEAMYLTASVMRLAGCAVGGGNSDLFARASGIDYYVEPSVGEFVLGSRRDPDRRGVQP